MDPAGRVLAWARLLEGVDGIAGLHEFLRPVAGDTAGAQAVKVVARAHKTLVWERTRHLQRLRHQLRDYFGAALVAFADLAAPDTLELPATAPDPAAAARLSSAEITAALRRCAAPAAATSRIRPPRSRLRCARRT